MPYALKRPRLWYERRGSGEPLLLITGFAISAAVFEPMLPLYARHFDCIYYAFFARRGPIRLGVRNTGLAARVEPVTRVFGLPVGALRTGASLLRTGRGAPADSKSNEGGQDVAVDRRAA